MTPPTSALTFAPSAAALAVQVTPPTARVQTMKNDVYMRTGSTRGGVYSDESIYGSLYYGKWEADDRYEAEAQYEYLEEDRMAIPSTISRNSSSASLPPPLPPPNRRRSSMTSIDFSTHSTSPTMDRGTWLHPPMSREEAEDILSQDMRSGAFLVRIKVPDEQWALSMVWKGMFVHHLISLNLDSREFSINDEAVPCSLVGIADLIEFLRLHQSDAFRIIEQDLRHPLAPR